MINSKQRSFLRAAANSLDSLVQIGKSGVSELVLKQYDEILTARELVKTNVLKTCEDTPQNIARQIAESVHADVVGVVGRKFVLYRKSEKLAKDGKSMILPW